MINDKKNNNQNYIKVLFSTSLIFEQNIDKLWLFLRDLNNEVKVIDYLDNLKLIKGDNTWNKGNIFSFNWIGLSPLKIICKNIDSNKNKKVIKWKVIAQIGIEYYKELCLYKIIQNDKTLVKIIISTRENTNELVDLENTKNYYLNLEYNKLLKKSNYLKNLKEDIILYDSCIINSNYLKVWNLILDFKKVALIGTDFIYDMEYSTTEIKEGTFFKFFLNDLKIKIFIRVKEIKTNKKSKTWKLKLEVISSDNKFLPRIIEFKIIIINNNKTQLSILHKFNNYVNEEILKNMNFIRKDSLKKYKKYLEGENEIK